MSDDIEHRLDNLEQATKDLKQTDMAMQQTLQELVINTQIMNMTLKMLTDDVLPRVKDLEKINSETQRQLSNNNLIIKAVKGVAMLVASVGISMIMLHLFGG